MRQQVLGDVLVVKGIEQNDIVLPAFTRRAFDEHPAIDFGDVRRCVIVKAEKPLGDFGDCRVDLDHFDLRLGQQRAQGCGYRTAAQANDEYAARVILREQRAGQHHAGVVQRKALRVAQFDTRLPADAALPRKTHATQPVLLVHQHFAVQRTL